jgi:SAM-dependent methyltransferase
MSIDYNHSNNLHTLEGARAALSLIFEEVKPASLLDVGCGTGTWMKAALELGIADACGVDGIELDEGDLLFPKTLFIIKDLTAPLKLGRKFDLVLCLDVAEHLEPEEGRTLISSLTEHADTILFSAAPPNQPGQHHVNCQWPSYWQKFFNDQGFACEDTVRWRLWNDDTIEPWYRQNIFLARRIPYKAGLEERIRPVIHPDFIRFIEPWHRQVISNETFMTHLHQIERGRMPLNWYFNATATAAYSKLRRLILCR